jgi:DNA-binding transcriptional MocR family regulator
VDIALDRTSETPLYLQVLNALRGMILSGSLPPGFRLPPERGLAGTLAVNRSTVLAAYRELKAEGLVDAHVGRGTVVLAQPFATPGPEPRGELPWRQLFRADALVQDPLVRDLLDLTERADVISFAAGLPAPELVPLEALRALLADIFAEVGPDVLLHCPTEGLGPLREALAELMERRGISCSPADVLVLSGSQQGIDLVARVLLDPGDVVVVEQPSFFGALQVFRAAQARPVGVPVDEDGMRPDALEAVLQRYRPKLIYTLPSFQNPSSAVLSPARRMRLLELSYQYQVPVLEDDPYSELAYDGPPPPSLRALDRRGHVIYLSTFSKSLFPGMRLGWIAAPTAMHRQLVLAKQIVDLHSNTPGQWLLERFLRQGRYPTHIARVREAYRERRATVDATLRGAGIPGLEWRLPAGGFYFWCRLPEEVHTGRLLAHAAAAGVSFLPGGACFVDDPGAGFARLNFTYPPADRLAEGIGRFAAAVREVLGAPPLVSRAAGGTRPIV